MAAPARINTVERVEQPRQDLVRNPDLLECVNTARGEREVNGAPADEISRVRISSALVEIDFGDQPAFASGVPKVASYEAGTWGPSEADDLLARDGRSWRTP